MSSQIGEALTGRAKEFNIVVEDVALTDIAFGPEFTAAIEAKQVGTNFERDFFFVFFLSCLFFLHKLQLNKKLKDLDSL